MIFLSHFYRGRWEQLCSMFRESATVPAFEWDANVPRMGAILSARGNLLAG